MPIILQKRKPENLIYGVWEITETEEELLKDLILSEEEKKILNNIKLPIKRRQWISYHKLIKTLLWQNEYQGITYNKHGKPFLRNLSFNISVSHTENYSSAIIGKDMPVGIDIETTDNKILKIEKKFLSAKEISLLPEINRTMVLHIMWGVKESIYKLMGMQNVIFAEDLQISSITDNKENCIYCTFQKNTITENFVAFYEIIKNMMLVYAVPENFVEHHCY